MVIVIGPSGLAFTTSSKIFNSFRPSPPERRSNASVSFSFIFSSSFKILFGFFMATVFWIIIFIINEIYLNNLKFNLVKINAVWPIFKF